MKLTSRMKMARFKTFWIQMRKNKPLNEIAKLAKPQGRKWHFTQNVGKLNVFLTMRATIMQELEQE
ncbi:hypothetical protein Hanom_Chr04g00369181 [Helianthus anomalus]